MKKLLLLLPLLPLLLNLNSCTTVVEPEATPTVTRESSTTIHTNAYPAVQRSTTVIQ